MPSYQTIVFELEEVLRGKSSQQRVPVRFPVHPGTSAARIDGVVGLSMTWFAANRRFLLGLKLQPQGEGESLVYSSWLSDLGIPLNSIDSIQARRMLAGDAWDSGFPGSWAGTWSGELQYAKPGDGKPGVPGGPKGHIQMGLLLGKEKKDGPYRWSIRYGKGEDAQIRPYELIVVDPAKGQYEIDEHNGIRIDSYLVGSTLYARFDVKTVSVETIYRRRGDKMMVTMISTEIKPTVPEDAVRSHRVISVTRAVLTRTQ